MKKFFIGLTAGFTVAAIALLSLQFVRAEGDSTGSSTMGMKKDAMEHRVEIMQKTSDRLEDRLDDLWKKGGPNENDRTVILKANGDFRASGATVNSVDVANNRLNVSFYGFSRDISVAGAKLIGGGQSITLADFKAGDKLAGSGNFNSETKTLTIKEVHDLSYRRNKVADNIRSRIDALLKQIEELKAKLQSAQ